MPAIPMSAREIREDLRTRIRSGERGYRPGDRLPKLRELAALYGVHTATIQRALDPLKDSGLIEGRSGLGMFVADPLPPA